MTLSRQARAIYGRGSGDPDACSDWDVLKALRPKPPEEWWSERVGLLMGYATPLDVAVVILDDRFKIHDIRDDLRAFAMWCYGLNDDYVCARLGVDAEALMLLRRQAVLFLQRKVAFIMWSHKMDPASVPLKAALPFTDKVTWMGKAEVDPLTVTGWGKLGAGAARAILARKVPPDESKSLSNGRWWWR